MNDKQMAELAQKLASELEYSESMAIAQPLAFYKDQASWNKTPCDANQAIALRFATIYACKHDPGAEPVEFAPVASRNLWIGLGWAVMAVVALIVSAMCVLDHTTVPVAVFRVTAVCAVFGFFLIVAIRETISGGAK